MRPRALCQLPGGPCGRGPETNTGLSCRLLCQRRALSHCCPAGLCSPRARRGSRPPSRHLQAASQPKNASEAATTSKGGADKAGGSGAAGAAGGKAKKAAVAAKDLPVDISRVDLRVGLITKAAKHPDADSLYVEDIMCGEEAPRVVVSGLVKHIPEPEMQQRLVVVVANLKPANLKGIKSHAMVLAATGADGKVRSRCHCAAHAVAALHIAAGTTACSSAEMCAHAAAAGAQRHCRDPVVEVHGMCVYDRSAAGGRCVVCTRLAATAYRGHRGRPCYFAVALEAHCSQAQTCHGSRACTTGSTL